MNVLKQFTGKHKSVLLPILTTIACVLFMPVFYHEVDDRFLQDIILSASYNEHSEYLHIVGIPIGFIARWLTMAIPCVNWLAVIYFTAITLSFIAFNSFARKFGRDEKRNLYFYIALALLQVLTFLCFTFTMVGFVAVAASAVFGLCHVRTRKDAWYLIPFILACSLAPMIRFMIEVLYVAGAFAIVLSLYLLFSKKTSVLSVILVLSILFFGTIGMRKLCYAYIESEGWRDMNQFHYARADITDSAYFSYEDTREKLEEKGISENDLKMIYQLLISDMSVFNTEMLRDVADAQTTENKYELNIGAFLKHMITDGYFICITVLFLFMLLLSPKAWFWFSGLYGTSFLFVAYLYIRKRSEPRIVFSVVLIAAIFLLLCLCAEGNAWLLEKHVTSNKAKKCVKKVVVIMLIGVLGCIGLKQYRNLYIEYHALQSRQAIFDYANEHPEQYITASAWTRNWLYEKRVRMLTKNIKEHVIDSPYGDWYLYNYYYYARMEKYGVGDYAEKALLMPIELSECYFLALNQEEIPLMITYYREHYGIHATAQEVASFNEDRFKLYKFHVVEKQ